MLSPGTVSSRYPYSRSESATARSGNPTHATFRTRFRMSRLPRRRPDKGAPAREGGEQAYPPQPQPAPGTPSGPTPTVQPPLHCRRPASGVGHQTKRTPPSPEPQAFKRPTWALDLDLDLDREAPKARVLKPGL